MSEHLNYHVIDLKNGSALLSRKCQLTASEKPLQGDEIAINLMVELIEKLNLKSQLAEKDKAISEAEDVINKLMFTIINYTDYPGYEIECSKYWLEKYGRNKQLDDKE